MPTVMKTRRRPKEPCYQYSAEEITTINARCKTQPGCTTAAVIAELEKPLQPKDARYSITREYTGHISANRRYVLRFCGDFISSHGSLVAAKAARAHHVHKRVKSNQF